MAAKIIRTSDEETSLILKREFELLESLDHPNIVKSHAININLLNGQSHLIMDIVQGVCLTDYAEGGLAEIITKQLFK